MRLIWLSALLLAGAAASAEAQTRQQRPRFEELARQFEYDRKASLDVREAGREKREGGVTVIDLTYASPLGGRVPAYLVLPAGRGEGPARALRRRGVGGAPP